MNYRFAVETLGGAEAQIPPENIRMITKNMFLLENDGAYIVSNGPQGSTVKTNSA